MGEFRAHTGLSTCTCVSCDLINCGAIDRSWDGWSWAEFAGEARVAMMRVVRQEPVRGVGPKTRWAGCVDWFRVMGEALDFDDAEGDDDEPA